MSAVPSETEAPPDTESTSGSETEEDIEAEPASVKIQARLLMRSEGVYRVLLNAPIYREISVGDRNGDLPKDRLLLFPVVQDGKPLNMALRVRRTPISFGNVLATHVHGHTVQPETLSCSRAMRRTQLIQNRAYRWPTILSPRSCGTASTR